MRLKKKKSIHSVRNEGIAKSVLKGPGEEKVRVSFEGIPRCNREVDYPGIATFARQPSSCTPGSIDIQLGARHGNFPWSEGNIPSNDAVQVLLVRGSVHPDAKLTTQQSITLE